MSLFNLTIKNDFINEGCSEETLKELKAVSIYKY